MTGRVPKKVLDEQKAAEKALSDAKTKEVEAAQKLDEAKKADADRDAKIKDLTTKEAEQAVAKTDAENALAEAKKAAKEAAEAKRDALRKELDANMTREQAKALTQYYAHLITAVRRQFWGTKVKTYTTEEAMDYVSKRLPKRMPKKTNHGHLVTVMMH